MCIVTLFVLLPTWCGAVDGDEDKGEGKGKGEGEDQNGNGTTRKIACVVPLLSGQG